MADPVAEFFDGLPKRGSALLPGTATGSVQFELTGEHDSEFWRLGIDRGAVRVSRGEAAADCMMRADQSLFDAVVSGRVNVMAALLRGEVAIDGDLEMLVLVQRLFPGPQRESRSRLATAPGGSRER